MSGARRALRVLKGCARGPYAKAAIVTTIATSAVGFLPLFGGPGYEHALATGLVVPSAAAIATSLSAARAEDDTRTPLGSVTRGLLSGAALAGIALGTSLVHAVRVGLCEVWGALVYFGLTAFAGAILGGAWGAVVGEVVAAAWRRGAIERARLRAVLAVLLALGGPVGCVAISVYRFAETPMVFAFDPFVGYFSGTLYDTVIDAGTPLLTYRLGTLATVTAIALAASCAERRPDRPYGVVFGLRDASSRGRAGLALACAFASAAVTFFGTTLGHFSTPASIVAALGAQKSGERCDVIYPATTREQEALLLVKDCDEQLVAVEGFFGARGPSRVRAFFFRDAEEKKRLMGAAHTYIAKPWREEVYLQLGGYPHPVLGHELAHVVAGSFGRGPFRIAGSYGGLVPNPGLIEGVAVAASPDDDDLTDAQWALAMKEAGLLPPMRRVFSLGFLGDASSKSYTLAGAFVEWIASRYGMETVRAWYGGGDVEALTKKGWPELEADFGAYLAERPLPPEAQSFARAKFARPSVFGRKCPHVVDALRREADVCRDSQRYADAIRLYGEAFGKDPHDFASRKEQAAVMRRHGDREEGRRALTALATADDKTVPRTYRDRAEESLADAELIDGAYEAAAARYDALAAKTVDEDQARTLEIKAIAARSSDARPAVQALLLGDARRGPDVFVGGVALGRWKVEAPSPLVDYLVGRNLVGRGFYEEGARYLDAALAGELPTPRVARETLRMRAVAGCALGDREALERVRARISGPDDPFAGGGGGRREATLQTIARCTR